MLLTLLDAEIADCRAEDARNGWNLWGLYAAIAAVCIAATDTWEHNTLSLSFIVNYVIGLVAIYYVTVGHIAAFLRMKRLDVEPRRSKILREIEPHKRPQYILRFLYCVLLGWMALRAMPAVPFHARYMAVSMFAIGAISSAKWFVQSFTDKEIEGRSDLSPAELWMYMSIYMLLVTAYCLTVAAGYFRPVSTLASGHVVGELRVAVMIIVFGVLVFTIIAQLQQPAFSTTLSQIRRHCLLGHVTVDVAIKQTERVLLGMDATSRYEFHMIRVVAEYRDIDTTIQTLVATVDTLLTDTLASATRPDRVRKDDEGTASFKRRLAAANKQLKRTRRRADKVQQRRQLLIEEGIDESTLHPEVTMANVNAYLLALGAPVFGYQTYTDMTKCQEILTEIQRLIDELDAR